jgi:hypothetical protein
MSNITYLTHIAVALSQLLHTRHHVSIKSVEPFVFGNSVEVTFNVNPDYLRDAGAVTIKLVGDDKLDAIIFESEAKEYCSTIYGYGQRPLTEFNIDLINKFADRIYWLATHPHLLNVIDLITKNGAFMADARTAPLRTLSVMSDMADKYMVNALSDIDAVLYMNPEDYVKRLENVDVFVAFHENAAKFLAAKWSEFEQEPECNSAPEPEPKVETPFELEPTDISYADGLDELAKGRLYNKAASLRRGTPKRVSLEDVPERNLRLLARFLGAPVDGSVIGSLYNFHRLAFKPKHVIDVVNSPLGLFYPVFNCVDFTHVIPRLGATMGAHYRIKMNDIFKNLSVDGAVVWRFVSDVSQVKLEITYSSTCGSKKQAPVTMQKTYTFNSMDDVKHLYLSLREFMVTLTDVVCVMKNATREEVIADFVDPNLALINVGE